MRWRWDRAGRALGLGVAFAAGFASASPALIGPLAPRRMSARELPVRLWACDTAAATLVGLDRDLIVRRRVELPGVRAVAGAPAGGAWALVEREGVVEILRLAASGECLARHPLSRPTVLRPGPGGRALLFERDVGRQRSILILEDGQRPRVLAVLAGVRCAEWGGSDVLLGTSAGELFLFSEAGRVLATSVLGSAITSVTTTADGSHWALCDAGDLVRLDARLQVRARSRLEGAGTTGAELVGLDGGRVVVLDPGRGELVAYGSAAIPDWTRQETFLVGLGAGVGWRSGVVVTTPGALVAFDDGGGCLPGQGGFEFLTAVGRTGP